MVCGGEDKGPWLNGSCPVHLQQRLEMAAGTAAQSCRGGLHARAPAPLSSSGTAFSPLLASGPRQATPPGQSRAWERAWCAGAALVAGARPPYPRLLAPGEPSSMAAALPGARQQVCGARESTGRGTAAQRAPPPARRPRPPPRLTASACLPNHRCSALNSHPAPSHTAAHTSCPTCPCLSDTLTLTRCLADTSAGPGGASPAVTPFVDGRRQLEPGIVESECLWGWAWAHGCPEGGGCGRGQQGAAACARACNSSTLQSRWTPHKPTSAPAPDRPPHPTPPTHLLAHASFCSGRQPL